jgi:hypothetical protein
MSSGVLTSIVSQSIGTPWPPSQPVSSIAVLMRSRVSGSRSLFSVSAGPPLLAQLGMRAASVVHPGRYG